MGRGRWLALALGGLAVYGLAAVWVRSPGYMDADYYMATANEIVRGHGLQELFLWNYLDDPSGLPHPSHLYWMPLTSFVAATGMAVFGEGFRAAQLPFILLAAALPAATAGLSLRIVRRPGLAWISGCLALFAGFFTPYFVTTDSFIIFAYAGGLALWLIAEASTHPRAALWLAAGAAVGLSHLARADGVLLVVPALLVALRAPARKGVQFSAVLLGYVGVMAAWWGRNVATTGSLVAPGISRTLWLTQYDELFTYPAALLNPAHLWSSGIAAILGARAWALGENLMTVLAVDGLVFLLPLMLIGGWTMRRQPLVQAAVLYLGLLLVTMSFVFPFPGARGGVFHSSAALMPALWVLAPVGLEGAVGWAARGRRWPADQAQKVFATAAIVLAGAFTLGLYVPKVIEQPGWDASWRTHVEVSGTLSGLDTDPGVVAVNNPPGFNLASGFPAVVIPDGDPGKLQSVVERYGVSWVILEANHPAGLASLYADPGSVDWLQVRASFPDGQGRQIYLLQVSPASGGG